MKNEHNVGDVVWWNDRECKASGTYEIVAIKEDGLELKKVAVDNDDEELINEIRNFKV